MKEMCDIKRILRNFQLMSGLKINYAKSSLCGVKVSNQDVISLARSGDGVQGGNATNQISGLTIGCESKKH